MTNLDDNLTKITGAPIIEHCPKCRWAVVKWPTLKRKWNPCPACHPILASILYRSWFPVTAWLKGRR